MGARTRDRARRSSGSGAVSPRPTTVPPPGVAVPGPAARLNLDASPPSNALRPRRPAAGLAVSGAWLPAALAIVGWWALPIGRPNRPFLTLEPDLYAVAIGHPLLWLTLLAAVPRSASPSCPWPPRAAATSCWCREPSRWRRWSAGSCSARRPFGMGALLVLAGLVMLLGNALSESGRVQGDAFIASSILFVSLFVLLFIIYPLFTVLRSSIYIDGRFDFSVFLRTMQHPLFFMLGNERSAVDEVGLTLRWGAGGPGRLRRVRPLAAGADGPGSCRVRCSAARSASSSACCSTATARCPPACCSCRSSPPPRRCWAWPSRCSVSARASARCAARSTSSASCRSSRRRSCSPSP
jgi:hypothetical protein